MSSKKKIKTVAGLDAEILRLKLRAFELEEKLEDNVDHLKDNYGSMAFNSVFKRKNSSFGASANGNHFWSAFTTRVLDNEKLQANIGSTVERFVERLSEGVENLFGRIFKKG